MKGQKIYILRSTYKDGDPENIGLYDSPLAMIEGLATAVAAEVTDRVKGPMELAKAVARTVYTFSVIGAGLKPDADVEECRIGSTVYGWEVGPVLSCEDAEHASDPEGRQS